MRYLSFFITILFLLGLPIASAAGYYLMGDQEASYLIKNKSGTDFIPNYRNNGFQQKVERLSEGISKVFLRVDLEPIPDPVGRLEATTAGPRGKVEARETLARITSGILSSSNSKCEAILRILRWIRENITYEAFLAEEDPGRILAGKKANCIGLSRLAESMLAEARIESRQVHGILIPRNPPPPEGVEITLTSETLHRWLEFHIEGAGWFFADPLSSFYFVDSNHILIMVDTGERTFLADKLKGTTIVPLSRRDRTFVVETFPHRRGTVYSRFYDLDGRNGLYGKP